MRFLPIFAAVLVANSAAAEAKKPNIVIILADDLGGADLACYGSTFHKTPHLDRFAKDGLRFTTAYAAAPICSPTRAALLTGKHPARLNLTDWLPGRGDRPEQRLLRPKINPHLPLEETTLAEYLKKAGYTTALVGKWHLGGDGFSPEKQGFDVNIGGDHTGTPLSYFAPFKRGDRFMPGLEKAEPGEYLTDRLTTEAERFIERARDKPFFLYLAHNAVHIPMKAKKELIEKYPQKPIPGQQSNAVYAAMLESLDDSVGRILKKLDELKLTDNTLLIFTSDNGGLATLEGPDTPPTINSPFREGKGFLYEGGLRVPLIIKWPKLVKSGQVSDMPTVTQDLFHTIRDIAGHKLEKGSDGTSLLPVLQGKDAPQRLALFWHYPHYSNQGGKPSGAIRKGDYKLIVFYDNNRRELYDLMKDPRESRNLAEENKEKVEELTLALERWRNETNAAMPTPNPNFVPNPQAGDGTITLHARTAEVHGVQLRYEPLPHKDTLGYWTQEKDWARFEFTVKKPGVFSVEVLQGCGKDHGGSVVEFACADQKLSMTVEDTGGFQNFKAREIGTLKIDKPGRYTLEVKPKSKKSVAVMDLRQITLRPQP